MMMMVDTGTPKGPQQPFLWWALLLGSAYFALHFMRSCAEGVL